MDIVTRAEWGARLPRSVIRVELSERRQFIVHYSSASKLQTVRSIQDFHMDTKGWTDIGYNFLCDYRGNLYMGRGWYARGTHTVGFNTTGIACCFIGTDADVTEEAKRSIRWLADEANRLTGRTLERGGHRDYDQTSCPGDNLWRWVHSGMPVMEGDEMVLGKLKIGDDTVWRSNGIERVAMTDVDALNALLAVGHRIAMFNTAGELKDALGPIWMPAPPAVVDVAALVAELRTLLLAEVRQIVDEELDEQSRAGADADT